MNISNLYLVFQPPVYESLSPLFQQLSAQVVLEKRCMQYHFLANYPKHVLPALISSFILAECMFPAVMALLKLRQRIWYVFRFALEFFSGQTILNLEHFKAFSFAISTLFIFLNIFGTPRPSLNTNLFQFITELGNEFLVVMKRNSTIPELRLI